MNIITNLTFTASFAIGKQIGYTKQFFEKPKLIIYLQEVQQTQISERNIYLSACISECEIIMSGQIEPHFKLEFINYPKFPLSLEKFKHEVEIVTKFLMEKLKQNRIVIVFQDETKMLENNERIDPRI